MKESINTDTPINFEIVQNKIKESGLEQVGKASIRELVTLVNNIEAASGEKYIRMEMGVPGLKTPQIGIDAEIQAIKNGATSAYPLLEGIPQIKEETSHFAKNFLNIDINPKGIYPTTGSLQGSLACFITIDRMFADRDTTLFIDPGFPLHKQQITMIKQKVESFDVYDYRGEKLRDKLESYFKKGNIHSVLYSNPNNPSWICFTENELKIIGELATKYNVIIIEDLAYFSMDFRNDISKPGVPPYQATVANYTDNYVILFSASKLFSYPGPRLGLMMISNKLQTLKVPELKNHFNSDVFGYCMLFGVLYPLSAGASNSAQYGIAAILKAINNGEYNIRQDVIEYGRRAKVVKELFIKYGFNIVYDKDEDKPIADGFYFTISYHGFDGVDLVEELLYYGISAISLLTTRSLRTEGLRACVSFTLPEQFPVLENRLKKFRENHQ